MLFHDSIEENVKIANRNATHEQVVAACRKASIHDFIMTLPQGYDTSVGELGDTSRAVSGSGSVWHGHFCTMHRSFCWTNRRATSTA